MGKGPSQKVRGGEPWGSLRLHLSVRLAGLAVLTFPRFWEGMERELSIPLSSLYSPSDWGLYAPPSLSLSLNFASLCLFRPGLSSPGWRGGSCILFFLLKAKSPSPTPFPLPLPTPLPPPRGIVGGNKMWGESGAGRSPQCGAGRAQPMGSADGGARGGGAGAGRYFRGGRASGELSGRAERSCEASTRSGASGRASGREAERGRPGKLEGGRRRSARACGSRRPRRRRRRRLLPEEPRVHRPARALPQAIAAPPGPGADSPP